VSENILISALVNITLVLLIIALGIFIVLTAKSRNTKSFQFQISLFIVIWMTGEIADLLGEEGVIQIFSTNEIGMYIHVVAMALFSTMLWTRFYLARRTGKKLADTLEER